MNIKRKSTLYLCRGALIAALYTLLTWIAISMGIGNGFLQFRFSEAIVCCPFSCRRRWGDFTSAACLPTC